MIVCHTKREWKSEWEWDKKSDLVWYLVKKSICGGFDNAIIIYDPQVSSIAHSDMTSSTIFYGFKLGALENVLSMLRIIINEFDLNNHHTSDVTQSEVRAMSSIWSDEVET